MEEKKSNPIMPVWLMCKQHLQDQALCIAEDYIMFFWLSFCSNNLKHNAFFMTQVAFCFPTEHKNNIQRIWLIKDFYLTWESNAVSLSHM